VDANKENFFCSVAMRYGHSDVPPSNNNNFRLASHFAVALSGNRKPVGAYSLTITYGSLFSAGHEDEVECARRQLKHSTEAMAVERQITYVGHLLGDVQPVVAIGAGAEMDQWRAIAVDWKWHAAAERGQTMLPSLSWV
jgi:hypothetical protein